MRRREPRGAEQGSSEHSPGDRGNGSAVNARLICILHPAPFAREEEGVTRAGSGKGGRALRLGRATREGHANKIVYIGLPTPSEPGPEKDEKDA